ncbi:G2/mitotic-specific cyclin S13-7 isoform X2 [Cryptomeria japonica]|uniref:G2/mitotic-specific cyclin S13-7 isoform X2 n=1 Tax=Cryptomeria japonica TaxID=3369 RepID=UPI0025AD6741|nr:G2/mitotic-specific cyclin S13-7 isoform X2 [Cryptomeria japonica]
MASRAVQGRGVPNNRRALGDIGNIVGEINGKCNVKDGISGKPVLHVTRPVTRSFGAQLLANEKVTASNGSGIDKQAGAVNKQRRNSKPKDIPPAIVEVKDDTDDEEVTIVEPVPKAKGIRNRSGQAATRKLKPQTLTATLTARSEAFCGGFDAEMAEAEDLLPNIDIGDLDNQLAVVEYVEDIYKFYRKIEGMSCVPDYMPTQVEINEKMRAILIDWLIEVHYKFELMPETLYLTTNLADRYLSIEPVSRRNLQLVGVTAMLLASKYEEIWAPEINDFVCISDRAYTKQQIISMEKIMLNKLKFHLTVPTPYVFVVRYLKAADSDKEMENLVFFLIELSLLQYVTIKFTPSLLSAGAVYTARCTLKKDPIWNDLLKRHTGYSEADLMECARLMVTFHQNSADNKLKVVHKKYSAPQFDSVALLSPAKLPA